MTKVDYLCHERDGNYCICPDVTVTVPASQIQNKVDIHHSDITHKYPNAQLTEVYEEVNRTKLYILNFKPRLHAT